METINNIYIEKVVFFMFQYFEYSNPNGKAHVSIFVLKLMHLTL